MDMMKPKLLMGTQMKEYTEITNSELCTTSTSQKSKSCTLHHIPTSRLQQRLPGVLPSIQAIVNGTTLAIPPVKKSTLDPQNSLQSPISWESYREGCLAEKLPTTFPAIISLSLFSLQTKLARFYF